MKRDNVFLTSTYINPKYFCNRKNETERIISALKNDKNIILYGKKGIGKITLINHVLYVLRKDKDAASYFINLLDVENTGGFVVKLMEKANKEKDKNFEITSESINDESFSILERLLHKIGSKKVNTIIVVNEFQQINDFPKHEKTELLQLLTKRYENIQFIFLGNNGSKLQNLLNGYNLKDINKVDLFEIDTIDYKKYRSFIKKRFSKAGVKIDKKSINLILNLTRRHTYFTQHFCNKLFLLHVNRLNVSHVKQTFDNILKENEQHFLTYKNLLSPYQWKLIKAIAEEGEARQITSGKFINKHSLNAPSSVKTAEKSLLEKEMIYKINNYYQVANVFLEHWLTRKYTVA